MVSEALHTAVTDAQKNAEIKSHVMVAAWDFAPKVRVDWFKSDYLGIDLLDATRKPLRGLKCICNDSWDLGDTL